MFRLFILIVGPLTLTALCYAVAGPPMPHWELLVEKKNHKVLSEAFAGSQLKLPSLTSAELVNACRTEEARLKTQLPADFASFVKPPFVITGDLSARRLQEIVEKWVLPVQRALEMSYFDHPPQTPIALILLANDDSYSRCSRLLEGADRREYAGFYSRKTQRVVVNLSTGEGTLAHELTHALGHADFPEMPEWFDEGLASLHEECEYSADGASLLGVRNWRGHFLAEAMEANQLPTLDQLLLTEFGRSANPSLEYAHARYFCLYLQEQGLLTAFYRKCRTTDVTGHAALRTVCQVENLSQLETSFRQWLRTAAKPAAGGGKKPAAARQSQMPPRFHQARTWDDVGRS